MTQSCTIFNKEDIKMKNNKTKSSAIQKILKCGIISWVAIIALWGIGSLKYDEYFLPSPKETIDSMTELFGVTLLQASEE